MGGVRVAVRSGREGGADACRVERAGRVVRRVARAAGEPALRVGAFGQVALDDLAQEVAAGLGLGIDGCGHGNHLPRMGRWRWRDSIGGPA